MYVTIYLYLFILINMLGPRFSKAGFNNNNNILAMISFLLTCLTKA